MSTDQLSLARQFLGDQGSPPAFTDAELNANYDFAGTNFFLGLYYGVIQLEMNAVKLYSYTQGQSSVQVGGVFPNLAQMKETFYELSVSLGQVQFSGMAPIPERIRAWPWVQGSVSSVNYRPWFPSRGRNRGWGW
jgi:hypothetical protein